MCVHRIEMNKTMRYSLIGLAVFVVGVVLYIYYPRLRLDGFTSGGSTFTMYYASWCPHCKDVKPVFEQWATSQSNSMSVNGKSVTLQLVEESKMDKSESVKGFPTFLLKKTDGTTAEFSGDRSPSGWAAWLKSNL